MVSYQFAADALLTIDRLETEIAALKAAHDKRVTGLIEYASTQVVLRRAFRAKMDIAVKALESVSDNINEWSNIDSVCAEIHEALDEIKAFDPSVMGRP